MSQSKGIIMRTGTIEPLTGWVFLGADMGMEIDIETGKVIHAGGYTLDELQEIINSEGEHRWLLSGFEGLSIVMLGQEQVLQGKYAEEKS